MAEFSPLFFHSYYSFMESTLSLQDIIHIAKRYGIRDVILSDINGIYGMLFFQSMCLENGLRPVTACHLKYRNEDAYAVVMNRSGYRNLCNIISRVHKDNDRELADIIAKHSDGLLFFSEHSDLILNLRSACEIYPLIYAKKDWYYQLHIMKELKLPIFLAGEICCYDESDKEILRILKAIKNNTTPDRVNTDNAVSFTDYCSHYQSFSTGGMISDPAMITGRCDFVYDQGMIFISGKDSAERLKSLVYANIGKRYANPGSAVYSRIEKELSLIISKGFCDYFLTVYDIVQGRDYYCGRGSAAASIVAYLLYITDVDPVRHNLYFERFLNEAREDPPDIDIDFPWDERDDVLDYIFNRYSYENCALVSNVITFKDRMALREVGKVFGLPGEDISRITKRINYLSKEEEIISGFRDKRWKNIHRHAKRIRGFPRHLSVHCGGIIITPPRIYDYVPVEMAKKGMPIIQWEKDQAEMGGLVKIDILGNRTLAVIRDTIHNINEVEGTVYDYKTMEVTEDKRIKEAFSRGDSMGVFYLESPAIRMLQKKVGSGEFEDITIHSSIIRPAANRYINEYIRRRKGGAYESAHPVLKEVLSETCEIMVYQEDVEKTAIKLLEFSVKDSVMLRKSLTAKDPGRKEYYMGMFYKKGKEKGIPAGTLEKMWNMIDSFSGYSFNKPHSASYVMVSFKSGFFKTYYPSYFYAGVIENRGGYYKSDTYINYAKRLGINVHKPSVNQEKIGTTAIDDINIRLGWYFIKEITKATVDSIMYENKISRFRDFKDFYIRMRNKLDHSQVLILIFSGVFNEFVDFRNVLELLMQYLNLKGRELIGCKESLGALDEKRILFLEEKHYGFSLSEHPVAFTRKFLKGRYCLSEEIPSHSDKNISLLGYYVTLKLALTKKREGMAFISFEDEKDLFDCVLFPSAFSAFRDYLFCTNLFIIRGIVKREHNTYSVEVSDLTPILLK